MFVLAVKCKAAKGKEEELVQLLSKALAKVRQNEQDTLVFDLHRKIDDPTEVFIYERYKNRQAWAVTHLSAPYIKELLAALPNYLEVDAEITEYETVEVK